MDISQLEKGLVYTATEECIGCNNCIRECPTLESNVASLYEGGIHKIHVDGKECILCGTCLDTCTHKVRVFDDDFDRFLEDLKKGKQISMLVAPAFWLNYPDECGRILGYLSSLGVKKFYNVGFGADITVWAYIKYIQENNALGKIAQPCPVIVSYIEKHEPQLMENLIPIQSPMMCSAIYLKKYMGVTEELAFLSPCIAKKTEIESPRGLGMINYNVAFTSLMKHIRDSGTSLDSYPELTDEFDSGLGVMFPVPGGLRENVEFYLGHDALVVQAEGEMHVYEYLSGLLTKRLHTVIPTLVDVLNCRRGCSYGTATEFRNTNNNYVQIEAYRLKREKRTAFLEGGLLTQEERLAKLNDRFKHVNLDDFYCRYVRQFEYSPPPSEFQIEAAYRDMLKVTEVEKVMDCRACGYETCKRMAHVIILGLNYKENCVEYVKKKLAEQMSYQETVIEHFGEVDELLLQLNADNIRIAADATGINERVEEALIRSAEMRETLKEVLHEFNRISLAYSEIVSIARKTNMLSINATIEAAHAGYASKGFAVIANEMGDLAKKITSTANMNKEDSEVITKALEKLADSTNAFTGVVDDVQSSTDEIKSSVASITGKTEGILKLLDNLERNVSGEKEL